LIGRTTGKECQFENCAVAAKARALKLASAYWHSTIRQHLIVCRVAQGMIASSIARCFFWSWENGRTRTRA